MVVRKDLYKFIEICNKHCNELLTCEQALSIFGYSPKTDFYKTSAMWFLDIVYIPTASNTTIAARFKPVNWILTNKRFGNYSDRLVGYAFQIHNSKTCHHYFERERLYLYYKDKVPWWILKEYGGKL